MQIFMKFIFPQNYTFKNKLLGFIDYSTAIINIIWILIVFSIFYFIFSSISMTIFFGIIFCFPIVLLSISGLNGENILYVLSYLLKFFFKTKLLFFTKN